MENPRKRPHPFEEAHAPFHESEEDDFDPDMLPTDAEATIMLLRQKLYPDPASAAAAASAAKQSRHAKRSKSAAGPSKALAAVVTAAAAAAAAAQQLPPIVLKTQVYTVLQDRTAADRDLEGLRRQGRIRVFKLAMGADEYVLLLAADYMDLITNLIQRHEQLAAQPQPQQQQQQQAQEADPAAITAAAADTTEAAGIATTLKLFRDNVVPNWWDSTIPRTTLLQLLRTQHTSPQPAAAAAALRQTPASDAALERHLLKTDVVTRDHRSADSYLLTIPGAVPFVKSVLAGRQALLQALTRKKYQEALESELACIKLRSCCLTPSFILRDLQGRGQVVLMDTTAGPLVRLAQHTK